MTHLAADPGLSFFDVERAVKDGDGSEFLFSRALGRRVALSVEVVADPNVYRVEGEVAPEGRTLVFRGVAMRTAGTTTAMDPSGFRRADVLARSSGIPRTAPDRPLIWDRVQAVVNALVTAAAHDRGFDRFEVRLDPAFEISLAGRAARLTLAFDLHEDGWIAMFLD